MAAVSAMPNAGSSPKLAAKALPPPTNWAATYPTMKISMMAMSTVRRRPSRSPKRAAKKSGTVTQSYASAKWRRRFTGPTGEGHAGHAQ
jgi:hypothetical protein